MASQVGQHAKNPGDLIFTVVPLVPQIPAYLLSFAVIGRQVRPTSLRLLGESVPSVDIFVPCCGEDVEILLDTVRAACAIDYPTARRRVIVLDDGDSDEVKKRLESLPVQNVYYAARKVKVVTHSKASNINHGLSFVSDLPGGPSELCAVLDVDMIPLPHWLRTIVPYILQHDTVAMANPPQRFYNTPDGDPLEQSLKFIDVLMLQLEALNGAWCTGSGWVARRSAIDSIGGIPTEMILEDLAASTYLQAQGFKITYVFDSVQWGLVPDTFADHIKQAKRWAKGIAESVSILWLPRGRSLRTAQRLNASIHAFMFVSEMLLTSLFLLLMPAILFSGKPLIMYTTKQQLAMLLGLNYLQFSTQWLYGFITARAAHYHMRIWPPYRLARLFIMPYELLTLINLMSQTFAPTGRSSDGQHERQARASPSRWSRLKVMILDNGALFHVIIIAACITGALRSAFHATTPTTILATELLIRPFWPQASAILSAIIANCWVPISYALSPPAMPPRESLLVRDPVTQVAYPTEAAMDPERVSVSQAHAVGVLVYFSGVVFAALSSLVCDLGE